MIIYLDFDGTVVEHAYPFIGSENPYAMETVKMLQEAGHDIYFNTKRIEFNNRGFENALSFMYNHNKFKIKEFKYITSIKIIPLKWDWKTILETNTIYIDDIAPGIPLIKQSGKFPMVDWKEVQKQLKFHKII